MLFRSFPPEPDRIHLSNGTLFLDGTFVEGKPKIVRNRFPVSYKPNAPKPVSYTHLDVYKRQVPDTLQLFLEIILAKKVLRLPQPCVIHHIAFDDELF